MPFIARPILSIHGQEDDPTDMSRNRRIDGKAKVNYEKKM